MQETLKKSLVWTVLITLAVAFVVTAFVTKGFGLWGLVIPERSTIVAGEYDKKEKLAGVMFFSALKTETETVRVQRLVLREEGGELETFAGASKQNFGFKKYGDLLMQTQWLGTFEEKYEVVFRQAGEEVERIVISGMYISESELSPSGEVLALVMSEKAIDFNTSSAASDAKVYLYDRQSTELTEIGLGVSPQWDPTGRYLTFVSEEGVMVYNLTSQETELGLSIDGLELTYGMSDVSSNGKNLAVVEGRAVGIGLYQILNWDNFLVDIESDRTGPVPGDAHSPYFSPNARYVAFLVDLTDSEGVTSETKLWVYDQKTFEAASLPVDGSVETRLIGIDDWVLEE